MPLSTLLLLFEKAIKQSGQKMHEEMTNTEERKRVFEGIDRDFNY